MSVFVTTNGENVNVGDEVMPIDFIEAKKPRNLIQDNFKESICMSENILT